MSMRAKFEKMLAAGRDSAMLRLSLGECCLADDEPETAVSHLQQAVAQQPDYSAAWKLYGKALAANGESGRAIRAYEQGIAAAQANGDRQAAREMQVFKKRLTKHAASH